jgi:hypothetical protein
VRLPASRGSRPLHRHHHPAELRRLLLGGQEVQRLDVGLSDQKTVEGIGVADMGTLGVRSGNRKTLEVGRRQAFRQSVNSDRSFALPLSGGRATVLGTVAIMLLNVGLHCVLGVTSGMNYMAHREVGMVCRCLVVPGLVMPGGFFVMTCRMGKVF